jgi:hypothetical protein
MAWGGIKDNDGGMNSTMIYCKNFGKCTTVIILKGLKIKKKR